MKTVRFDKHYSKLDDKRFTTIRDHAKDVFRDDIVCIKTPKNNFKARCTLEELMRFKDIPIHILMNDLGIFNTGIDLEPHEYCLKEMQKIYPNLKLDNIVFVYYFEKVD